MLRLHQSIVKAAIPLEGMLFIAELRILKFAILLEEEGKNMESTKLTDNVVIFAIERLTEEGLICSLFAHTEEYHHRYDRR